MTTKCTGLIGKLYTRAWLLVSRCYSSEVKYGRCGAVTGEKK